MKILALLILSAAMSFAADISGKWTFNVVLDAGSGSPTFEFQQTGDKLTGTYHGQFGDAKLTGTVTGNNVEFTFSGQAGTVKYTGRSTERRRYLESANTERLGAGRLPERRISGVFRGDRSGTHSLTVRLN